MLYQEIISNFLANAKQSRNQEWQSVAIDDRNPTVDIRNLFFEFEGNSPYDREWCQATFAERVSGIPMNPGESYKIWPYRTEDFLNKEGKFSHTYMERMVNLEDVISRLNKNPFTRQAILSIWTKEDELDLDDPVRVPCSIFYHFQYTNGELDMTYSIRSCDIRRHLANDLYLANCLLSYVSHKANMLPGKLYVWVGNLHCFESDIYSLKKLSNVLNQG
jgi:thymidylate synthase